MLWLNVSKLVAETLPFARIVPCGVNTSDEVPLSRAVAVRIATKFVNDSEELECMKPRPTRCAVLENVSDEVPVNLAVARRIAVLENVTVTLPVRLPSALPMPICENVSVDAPTILASAVLVPDCENIRLLIPDKPPLLCSLEVLLNAMDAEPEKRPVAAVFAL